MKLIQTYLVLCCIALSLTVHAQIEIDHSVRLTGVAEADRQVTGVADADSLDNLVSAESVLNNVMNFAPASGTNNLLLALDPPLQAYEIGTIVTFLSSAENTAAVQVNINNLGFVPLKRSVLDDLDSADLRTGEIARMVYDGTNFQLLTPSEKTCPAGFVKVNERFCIEANEHSGTLFWNAISTCMDMDARMCTWGEWYYACQKAGLGLTGLTNNWEWVSSASNNVQQSKVVGNGSCEIGYLGNASVNNYSYRCCYSR